MSTNRVNTRKMHSISNNNKSKKRKEWSYWCRLCTKVDEHSWNIFAKNTEQHFKNKQIEVITAIKEILQIEIHHNDQLPHMLCTECATEIQSIKKFAERARKVQEMYKELKKQEISTCYDLRQFIDAKYGLTCKQEEETHLKVESDDDDFLTTKVEQQSSVMTVKTPTVLIMTKNVKRYKKQLVQVQQNQGAMDIKQSDDEDPLDEDSDFALCESPKSICTLVNYDTDELLSKDVADFGIQINEPQEVKDDEEMSEEQHTTNQRSENTNANENKEKESGEVGRRRRGRPLGTTKLPTLKDNRRVFTCPVCGEEFERKYLEVQHRETVHDLTKKKTYICEECGLNLNSRQTLRLHMFTHSKDEPYKCKYCEKRFKYRALLTKHQSIHGDKHICAECGLQLNSRATLYYHLTVHSDAMPHKCDYCGRAFKRSKTLKNHLMVHSGLRPYACDFCDRAFSNSTTCRQHKKNVHPKEFAEQEASGQKPQRLKNLPNLKYLKEITRTSKNLAPVVSKPTSGNYSLCNKLKLEKKKRELNGVGREVFQKWTTVAEAKDAPPTATNTNVPTKDASYSNNN